LAVRSKVDYWRELISAADLRRQETADRQEWALMKKIWDSGNAAKVVLHQDRENEVEGAFVNYVWAFAQTFIPAVYWRHPVVYVFPRREADQHKARIAQARLRVAFQETNFRRHLMLALQDMLIYGHGWIKLGWYTEVGQVPGSPSKGKLSTVDHELYLYHDAPYAYRVSPERIYVDPDASDYSEVRWIAQEYYRPLEAVRRDPYLRDTRNVSVVHFRDIRGVTPFQTEAVSETDQYVRIYEIWDREDGVVRILCEGSDTWNRVIDHWPYPGIYGFPFKFLAVTDAIDSFYPSSPILPWLPLVLELSEFRALRMDHTRRIVSKFMIQEGAMSEDQVRQFQDPAAEIVFAHDIDRIREFRGLQPDPNLYAAEEAIKKDIREISGFSELLSGSVPFSRIAATTSALMQRNATLRFDFYAHRVGEFIVECARDLLKIVAQYQSYPQTVRILGEPEPQWIEYTREEIDGEYDFHVDVEDMSVSTRQIRIKEAYDALVALSPFTNLVNIRSLLRDLLLAFGKSNLDEYLLPPAGPPADPAWENSLMVRGMPIEPNPNEDHELHLRVHEEFMRSPVYAQAVRQVPQIGQIFSEHIQKTIRMAELSQTAPQAPRLKPQQTLQEGERLATSAPVGGETRPLDLEAGLRNIVNQAIGG